MRTRLYVVAVLGGLALLAITVVVVFAFGRHDPSPPGLSDHPNPDIPGAVLYLDQDSCFRRAQASGAGEERLACVPQFPFAPFYWIADSTVAFVQSGTAGTMLYDFDLQTGAQSPTGRPVDVSPGREPPFGKFGGAYAPDGTYAFFEDDGELFLTENGERRSIASFDVPRYNQPQVALWSPDSQWILVQYYPPHADGPELWIISRDGSVRGTLTKDALSGPGGMAAWRIGDAFSPAVPD